jgi:hypothetical protein
MKFFIFSATEIEIVVLSVIWNVFGLFIVYLIFGKSILLPL